MQLVDYERYILDKNLVNPEKVSYYLAWVRRFLRLHVPERLSSDDKIKQFREYLNVGGGLRAVRLHFVVVFRRTTCPSIMQ